MPELPEVETVRRGLEPVMTDARITRLDQRRPDLRFPLPDRFAERLEERRITALSRRAKYLLAHVTGGDAEDDVLVMHLGMSGSFRIEHDGDSTLPGVFHHDRSRDQTHDHVVFDLATANDNAPIRIIYNDPRRFGFMLLEPEAGLETHPMFAQLGVEPLGNHLDSDYLAQALAGRRTPIKAALLDQRIIAGLGNIYVCEALFRAGISPRRLARTLVRASGAPTDRLAPLVGHIRDVLTEAIAAGGSSLRDHAAADGTLGYFQHTFRVYDRQGEPCLTPGCGGAIQRIVQSGRSSFYCPRCQR
ncbi:MAG: bifunctional DNA-formamidopyrimidine glycosylase/DNA-(apurinic or apyrimidinic site) lyase [Pseudomonadota bacterium]